MENRLKERLTGAAILVALVVMLVPEMFHGQRGDIAASPGSSGDGPPVRSYTIDLSNSPSGSAPLQSTPVTAANAGSDDKPAAAPQPAATNAAAANAAASSATPANMPAADVPGSAHAASAPTASPAPARAPVAASAAAATAVVAKAQPAAPASNTRPASAAHNLASGGWAVQLGLFAKRDNAERLVHSAQAKGFEVSVSAADARGLYRVYAGGMTDRAAAESYAQRLKDQGLPAAVIAAP
jgi:cell division septation protein DedD